MTDQKTYSIEIAGVKRDLRLFEIKPGLKIAILNILGDTELVQASARGLAEKVKGVEYDIIVTAEAKSIPIAHALSVETKKPYVVLRKTYKPYMGDALKAETLSITTVPRPRSPSLRRTPAPPAGGRSTSHGRAVCLR